MESGQEHTLAAESALPPPTPLAPSLHHVSESTTEDTAKVVEESEAPLAEALEAAPPAAAASSPINTGTSGARSRKRERVVNALSPLSRPPSAVVKTEPQGDPEEERSVAALTDQQPQARSAQLEVTRGEEEGREGHEEHSADPLPSATPGVATRRSHPPPLKQEDDAEGEVQGSEELVGRSSSSEGEDDDEDSMELSRMQNSSSRSHSAVPMTLTQPSSPTQRSGSPTSTSTSAAAGAARPRRDEALGALTQAAIAAQERQLCHTLLSIFPTHLRSMVAPPAAAEAAVGTPPCTPEPLLPLLHALCEDKIFVHAAWSRYEDDVAVRRTQNSIQRKRQRHSFNKGSRKSSTAAAAAAAAAALLAGSERANSDSDDADEGDGQPPQREWVESAPALTGPPRTSLPHTASQRHKTSSSSSPSSAQQICAGTISGGGVREDAAVAAAGFQWTPWRFFREKRLRGARRSQGTAVAAAAAAATTTATTTASASPLPTSAAGAASNTSSQALSSTVAAMSATTVSTTAPSTAAAIGGGVPSLLFSEVPSLPVLQVDAEVPEAVHAVVPAMTAEEQRTYARYVMSSGKLRNVCRDPYTFLVSRAKEMRIQWERQHPFE